MVYEVTQPVRAANRTLTSLSGRPRKLIRILFGICVCRGNHYAAAHQRWPQSCGRIGRQESHLASNRFRFVAIPIQFVGKRWSVLIGGLSCL